MIDLDATNVVNLSQNICSGIKWHGNIYMLLLYFLIFIGHSFCVPQYVITELSQKLS